MIITIDGPAGTGKSTVAKKLAEEIGYIFFDTGAMYRAITYGILKHGIDPDDTKALEKFLKAHPVTIKEHFNEMHFYLGDEEVSTKIRTGEVTNLVSKVSAKKAVRDELVATQRSLAHGVNAVFEGRDMGTVVFPDAEVKVFLTASAETRAERRYKELVAKGVNTTLKQVYDDIERRDTYDASRDISPMKAASDAIIIDTSTLSIDEVINQIIILTKEIEDKPLTSS